MSPPLPTLSQQGLGVVPADLLNTFIQNVLNVAQARTFVGQSGMQIYLMGFNAAGDGGAGVFYWNSGTISGDDNGVTTILPIGTIAGYWARQLVTANASTVALGGGLLLQFGEVLIASGTTTTVALPTPLATGLTSVLLTPLGGFTGGLYCATSFTLTTFGITQANSAAQTYAWMAIGK